MTESSLERAYALFKRASQELEDSLAPEELANRLRSVSHRILDVLEGNDGESDEDVFSRLEQKSRDIAEDLRRVERLMRKHNSERDNP